MASVSAVTGCNLPVLHHTRVFLPCQRHAAPPGSATGGRATAAAAASVCVQSQCRRSVATLCCPRSHTWFLHAPKAYASDSHAASVVVQDSDERQQQTKLGGEDAASYTYSLLHQLHSLCDSSSTMAAPMQLQEWADAAQPHLNNMTLAEVAYIASCLRHYQHVMLQQQAAPGQHTYPPSVGGGFALAPGFLQQACAAACTASSTLLQGLQEHSSSDDAAAEQQHTHQQLAESLQQLLELLQWSAAEVMHQRQVLQLQLQQHAQQLQQLQQVAAHSPARLTELQAHRWKLQQQVEAQQQAQQLLQHPLLLLALPHATCWQLQQLLVCSGQLGLTQLGFDWMGYWLAAARHAMSDLALSYQQQQQSWHTQHHHHHSQQQQHADHRAAAAAAYMQLVGLLSGLAAAHMKPPEAWLAAWQQAAVTVLAAQPCFTTLDGPAAAGSSGSDSESDSDRQHSSFFNTLQQLLQAVSDLKLRLSSDFWAAHEGLVQQHVLCLSPAGLLRVVQLHQQLNLRPSRTCVKYMAAVLEQLLQQQQQQMPGSGGSAALQLVMCACGLSVWGVRLHLSAVAELLLRLERNKEQLPMTVLLQVLTILSARLARVYTLGSSTFTTSSSSSSSSGSYSSDSMSSFSLDGEECSAVAGAAAAAATTTSSSAVCDPAAPSAAAGIERLLLFAADQLAAPHRSKGVQTANVAPNGAAAGATGSSAVSSDSSSSSSSSRQVECDLLLKLLQVCATLARTCSRASSSSSSQLGSMDSITSFAAAAAAAPGSPSSTSAAGGGAAGGAVGGAAHSYSLVDQMVHKLHPVCAAAAQDCSPRQLVSLMATWNQLGFSAAWRFGGFRRAYKRLAQGELLRGLSNAELAAAVDAVARLPAREAVVLALADEVMHRQQQQHQQEEGEAAAEEFSAAGSTGAAAAATRAAVPVAPLSAADLLTVVCAVPGLNPVWPASLTLLLLHEIQGLLDVALNPSQQWRLWNALQQLQQQWKPAVVAAAAAAAAASASTSGVQAHAPVVVPNGSSSSNSSRSAAAAAAASTDHMHTGVAFAAAAAAASLKASACSSSGAVCTANSSSQAARQTGGLMGAPPRPSLNGAPSSPISSSSTTRSSSSNQQQHQQQLMALLDQLQDQVAAALARVQPEALPVEAAPPRVPRPLHAEEAAAAGAGGRDGGSSEAGLTGQARLQDKEGLHTKQQVLAAFAKAQKSLLNPHCNGAALVKVLEGLVLLLSVPRYAKAAKQNDIVRRAVLRALEAAAWPDLLAQAMDLQQLLLLTAASRALGATPDCPYMQLLSQETSRLLAAAPLLLLAAALGRVAALRLPELYRPDVVLLKFWVGRLTQAAQQRPQEALAVVVPLTQMGFRPAAGAAALVLNPLLSAAAGATHQSSSTTSSATSSSDDSSSTSSSARGEPPLPAVLLSPASVLELTAVLAEAGLLPNTASTQQLLAAHTSVMKHCSVQQLLQLARDAFRLELLTAGSPYAAAGAVVAPGPAGAGVYCSSSSSTAAREAAAAQKSWWVPAAGAWVDTWLKQLLKRDTAQMNAAQAVELQMLLCELDMAPWHLSPTHSAHIHTALQQLQAKLEAAPVDWQHPLAAAVQASYHSTQELRRLVAAQARRAAHLPGSSNSSIGSSIGRNAAGGNAAAGGPSTAMSLSVVRAAVASAMQPADGSNDASGSVDARGTVGGTRRYVSRQAAVAAVAAAAGDMAAAVGGFSYPANALNHQLQQLSHQKRVLLWTAIKHRVVQPLNAAWVESCCFNVLVGRHHLSPAVATGLLLAVAEARRASVATQAASVSPSTSPAPAAAASAVGSGEREMRDRALSDLTAELVGRVVSALQVLKGSLFVHTLATLAAAMPAAASPAAAKEETVPLIQLTARQQGALLTAVARVLPLLQASQLPLLVNSMVRLQLQPDAVWLSEALQALAVKAAAAAAAEQPAQQLLLLAAAKQLLVCGGVLLVPAEDASEGLSPSTDQAFMQDQAAAAPELRPAPISPVVNRSRMPGAAAVLPVAYAVRALAAGAAQVLGAVFRRSQLHQGALQNGGGRLAGAAGPSSALATAAAVAAAMTDPEMAGTDTSVALLLSSLATQLQLAQPLAASASSDQATPTPTVAGSVGPQGLQMQQQQQGHLLAAAVLLHAGTPVADAGSSRPLRVTSRANQQQQQQRPWKGAQWNGLHRPQRLKEQARQQQQQRVLLGQLLQLQFLKASEQLVQSVWGANMREQQQLEPNSAAAAGSAGAGPNAAAAYATQVLLDPTGQLVGPPSQQQQQYGSKEGEVEEDKQAVVPQVLRNPQRLVAQGLMVQFDGLLRKAFMAAAAAAGQRQQQAEGTGGDGADASWPMLMPAQREPWWLPRPHNVSGLLQAAAVSEGGSTGFSNDVGNDDVSSLSVPVDARCSSVSADGVVASDGIGASGTAERAAVSGGNTDGSAQPVLVLPVMSRMLDAQFARLMREVLHSSLAAGGGSRRRGP